MAQTVLITLTTAGADTGPFNLYSNVDGFLVAFETGVSKIDLELGYTSYLVPDAATTIRVQSTSVLCSNYTDLVIGIPVTSTSTSSTSTTTTTTTTLAPSEYDFYFASLYECGVCTLLMTNVVVAFPTLTSVTIGRFYNEVIPNNNVYEITGVASVAPAIFLSTSGNQPSCGLMACI